MFERILEMKIRTGTHTNKYAKEYSVSIRRGKYNNLFVVSLFLTVYKPTREALDPRNTFVLKYTGSAFFSLPLVTLNVIYR